jgi:hypothetical protein
MKYVVVISAVVLFANEDQGGMRVPATKRKVKVKAMETGSRDLAFRVGGEIDNMDLMRTTDRAQFLLELTLVHELLHVHFAFMNNDEGHARQQEELIVSTLSRALVKLNRDGLTS